MDDSVSEKNLLFEVRGLRKEFPGGLIVLDGVDLDIIEGECLLVAGSNGSGKTVLMRILAGLLEPSSGTIRFRSETLEKVLKNNIVFRQQLGLVFQDAEAQFVGETVAEDAAFGPSNLGLSKTEIEERVTFALEKMGLQEKRNLSPRRLSGGEKRRLATAGVLAMGCRAIIMDEPFANLDYPGVVQVLEIINNLKQEGTSLVILTHELEKVLALADRLVILHRGRIQEDGKPEDVLNRLQPEYGVRDPRLSWNTQTFTNE
ncbi:MAG: energy-coupling factor ABC transporter ATP-binding protein [Treponema sp.]|jgi:biotin transport system ATP-binding protein|nr:energy-coupling factor ABC transporter ATP-binding protein [Treponema sp.]